MMNERIAVSNSIEDVRLPWSKSLFDKGLAFLILLATLPLDALIALAIIVDGWLEPQNRGPVFYSETRISQGRPFLLFKFRILKVRAIKEEIFQQKMMPKEVENRPGNLTRVGRVLKQIGIDEITQLWNILKGEMSFVGPRPKPVAEYKEEIGHGIYRRKVIRAGLSGPAQIMKGTNRGYEDELKADLEYIQKCRNLPAGKLLLIDLLILWKTIRVLLKRTGE